jgi:ribonuclease G
LLSFLRRFKQKPGEKAPYAAAPPAPAPVPAQESRPPAEGGSDATRPKRRRGTRGGRGRRKPTEPATAEPAAKAAKPAKTPAKAPTKTAAAAPAKPERKPAERRAEGERRGGRPRERRRRIQPKRGALPPAKRELLVSVAALEQRVAVIEDDRVAEVYLERPEKRSIAGNVYLGVVDNVLPGMEAAFVEIGLEKNGFLFVDEIVVPELEGKRHGKKITDLIQRSQTLLVQAVKDPMKTKGARLTTEISLPGRFVVFVPSGEGLGVSRRLPDEERTRLKDVIKALDVPEGGVIVRTAAEGASAEDVERDLVFLQRLWKRIQERAAEVKAPTLVYQEAELPLRVVRDLFTGDFERALVDDERAHKRIVGYLKKTSPHMVERVVRYRDKQPLFEAHGVEADLRSTISRRVDLPSGGYLIFDYAEAFTVIDVNTGRFVGSRSKSSAGRLEDTITKNNLEAVKEVVRQLRLRDIGGIIVIDFIDMANPKNRATVEEALRTELERDRTKTYVVEISPLGLVEMTRQNVTDGPREVMTKKCPICSGDGVVLADTTVAVDVERRLRELATGSRVQAFRVALNPRTLHLLAGPGGERLAALEAQTRRRFFPESAAGTELDHLEVLAQGKLEDLRPKGPVSEGDELDVKLVEVGLHDSGAAVAKLDGIEIAVADAARLVGKKVRVRVERVLDGAAFATRLDAAAPERPLTAEGEAEKPTRQPRARKAAAPEAKVEAGEEPVVGDAEPEEAEPVEGAGEADGEAAAAAKKRTRRGSRGGRGRKKKTATVAEGEPAAEAAAETAPETDAEPATEIRAERAEPPAAPRIHVPDEDLTLSVRDGDEAETEIAAGEDADGAQPAKKRTRRGSRGGRGRKKKTGADDVSANGDVAAEPLADEPDVSEPESAVEPEAAAEREPAELEPDPSEWEYTPMSEWGEDFDRRRR